MFVSFGWFVDTTEHRFNYGSARYNFSIRRTYEYYSMGIANHETLFASNV